MNAAGLVSAGGIVVERLTCQLYGTKCKKQGAGPASQEESEYQLNRSIEHHYREEKRQIGHRSKQKLPCIFLGVR